MTSQLVVDGLVEFTVGQIEAKAVEFLRRRPDSVPPPLSPPIDIELLLENTKDVQLETKAGLRSNYSVEGCVCNENGTQLLTVFVDHTIANGPNDAAYGEVLGEELAHILLHRAIIMQIDSIETFVEVRKHAKWKRIEHDAERLSRAIRVPAELVTSNIDDIYQSVVSDIGYSDSSSVFALIRNRFSELFVVPPETMTRRLAQWPFDWLSDSIQASTLANSEQLLTAEELQSVRQSLRQISFLDH